jgi:hypothetical protein
LQKEANNILLEKLVANYTLLSRLTPIIFHDSNGCCHHTNPTIVIVPWRLFGQNIQHFSVEQWEIFLLIKLLCNFVPNGVSQFALHAPSQGGF